MVIRISCLLFLSVSILFDCVLVEAASKNLKIKGVIAPVYTPYKNGINNSSQINYNAICKIDKIEQAGVDGIVIATSVTGEGYLLTYAECKRIYRICLQRARAAGVFMLATIGDPSPGGLDLAQYCDGLGVDGIIDIIPSLFYKPMTAQDVIRGMLLQAQNAPNTPVFLKIEKNGPFLDLNYNINEIYTLAVEQVPNFGGIIGSLEICNVIRAFDQFNSNTQILIATGPYSVQAAASVGINGTLSPASNLVPDLVSRIWYAKDQSDVSNYQAQLNRVIAAVATPGNYLPSTKVAYGVISGVCQGNVRPPLLPATCAMERNITRQLQKLGRVSNNPVSCICPNM